MIKKVPCSSCFFYEAGLQICREGPQPLKKRPDEWCGRGYPDYEIDPEEAKLYAGYLRTIHRQIMGLLDDNDSLGARLPRLLAWSAHVGELLDEGKPTYQMPHNPVKIEPEKVEMKALEYVAYVNSRKWGNGGINTPNWWDECKIFTVTCIDDLKEDAASMAHPGETIKALSKMGVGKSEVVLFFYFSPKDEPDSGWHGRLRYEWSEEPYIDGSVFRGRTLGGSSVTHYYRVDIIREDENVPSEHLPS